MLPEIRLYRKPKKNRKPRINKSLLISIATCALIFVLVCFQLPFSENPDDYGTADTLFESWRSCMAYNLRRYKNNSDALFQVIPGSVADCEKQALFRRLNPQSFAGKWWHLPPIYTDELGTVIAVNVNNNDAVNKLRREISNNAELYLSSAQATSARNDSGVIHFPFKVGAANGFQVEKIPGGPPAIITKINLVYFLNRTINASAVDNIWLNGDVEDYEILRYFSRHGDFNSSNITVCQSCIQLPRPTRRDKMIFHNFIFQLVEDGRYALFKTRTAGRVSLYLVNMESSYCRKFIPF